MRSKKTLIIGAALALTVCLAVPGVALATGNMQHHGRTQVECAQQGACGGQGDGNCESNSQGQGNVNCEGNGQGQGNINGNGACESDGVCDNSGNGAGQRNGVCDNSCAGAAQHDDHGNGNGQHSGGHSKHC